MLRRACRSGRAQYWSLMPCDVWSAMRRLDLVDGQARRDLAGGVPAHAVGDGEQPEPGLEQRNVLEVRAHAADVLAQREPDPEVEAGHDARHDT